MAYSSKVMAAPPLRLSLRELRAWTRRTQVQAAAENGMTQSELSRLERRDDFLLSTLRNYAASLGGSLEVNIVLGSSVIKLTDAERSAGSGSLASAIEGLASISRWLPAVLADLPDPALLERRAGCGAFSLLEHVWHLHDIDQLGYLQRVRRALREEDPLLADLDGDRLARERAYQNRRLEPALRELLRRRRAAVARLRGLGNSDLRRGATLEGTGPVALRDLILRWRTHDLGHRVEMERLASELRG